MARRNRKLAGLAPQVPKSGYGFLKAVLDCASARSEDLASTLDSPHKNGGNPGYPARQMLRLHFLRYLLGERYANHFLDRVGNDPRLMELCGLSNVPSEQAFSEFKNYKLAPHQEELDRILAIVAEDCAAQIKGSGYPLGDEIEKIAKLKSFTRARRKVTTGIAESVWRKRAQTKEVHSPIGHAGWATR